MQFHEFTKLWIPPERFNLSEWSERNLVLSSEYSSRSGLIQLHQYQKAIFDAFTDPTVNEITLMCSTQMVKSLLLMAIIAYIIVNDPAPILLVQPKDDMAKKFSKRRIDPMLRDTPALYGKVSESGAGHSSTIQEKTFPGGSLSIVGAGSPTNLASMSICYALFDEIDKYEIDTGNHGDPISQAEARLSTYGTRAKKIKVCSPTTEHESRIAESFQESDQRYPWVPCHACGQFQKLAWDDGVRFSDDKKLTIPKRAATAHYQCIHCGASWNDLQRWKACQQIEWRAEQPFNGHAGFTISHLYSPWHRLSEIVEEWLRSKNNFARRKTFINNSLCQTWKEDGVAPQEKALFDRREKYPFNENAVVPKGGLFITAAVDVQADRLECEVRAWGRNKESWSVAYEVIRVLAADGVTPLPSNSPALWAELDRRILFREWQHESGAMMPVWCMAIDTGYNAAAVYDYVSTHTQCAYNQATGMKVAAVRTVVPVRGGSSDVKIIEGVSTEDAARKRKNIRIVTVGTHCAKSELYELLRNVKPSESGEATPNLFHFPDYNFEYFASLCSEHRLVKANGQHEWKKKNPNARNEALDLAVYNRACSALFGIDRATESDWQRLEGQLNVKQDRPAAQTTPQPQRKERVVARFF